MRFLYQIPSLISRIFSERFREYGRKRKQGLLETTETLAFYCIKDMPDKVPALKEKVDKRDHPSLNRYTYHS